MLLRRTGRQHEQLVAARTVAGAIRQIFRNSGCALALARRIAAAGGLGQMFLLAPFPLPLPIPAALRLTTGLAVRTGPILPRRTPPPPATRR
jgi:hypothetical protein